MLGRVLEVLGQKVIEARTATADGSGLGTIEHDGGTIQQITVSCDDADKIIVLPPPAVGKIVIIHGGTTGYELRSSDPSSIGINGGTGAAVESAIPASTTAILFCATLTAWKGLQLSSTAGTLAKVEAAA